MEIRHPDITGDDNKLIQVLLKVWRDKRSRNWLRNRYYEGKNHVRNLGITLPPELASFSNVHLGWGAKAVDELAVRSRFDGFVYKGIDDPLVDTLRANNFFDLYRQATISELTNSCAFVTIGAGAEGEPPVILNAYAATQAAATWNAREKRISAGLVITKIPKEYGVEASDPTAFTVYTDDTVIECEKGTSSWDVRKTENIYGRPLMEALVYNPSLTKPFGTSRISRAAMSIIDRAMRCALRMDIAGEFFSAPQRYLLGAEEGVLDGRSKWEAYIYNIFAVSKDEEGDMPKYGQLPQMQLTPLTEQMRALAAEFSGETSIPISSLGIIHDNPASAEGIHAAREDLILEAESLNTTNGNALKNIGLLALAILGGYPSIEAMPDEWKTITPKFKNPARPSVVSQSDAMVKQVAAIPEIGQTTVALEELGYTADQIMRMKAEWVGAAARNTFREIAEEMSAQAEAVVS